MTHTAAAMVPAHSLGTRICMMLLIFALGACSVAEPSIKTAANAASAPKTINYQLLDTARHDARSFTQGLEIARHHIYESSGGYGRSFIRKSRYPDDQTVLEKRLPGNWFAEGLTVIGDKLYLLSWRQQRGLVLDAETLTPQAYFAYQGEGWGLCHMDGTIYMSNGTARLQKFNQRFESQASIVVGNEHKQWQDINELECAKGLVWANIWRKNIIIAIAPDTGEVVYQMDLSELNPGNKTPDAVLNGIAYDADKDAFWVTGKLWPKRYLIRPQLGPITGATHKSD